jgi:hypothetical protein
MTKKTIYNGNKESVVTIEEIYHETYDKAVSRKVPNNQGLHGVDRCHIWSRHLRY